MQRIAMGTWSKALTTMSGRSRELMSRPASPLIRAGQWNIYCVSTVLYPAQIAIPSTAARRCMSGCVRDVFYMQGWAPWWVVTALHAHWGIPGGPRCPIIAAEAAGVVTALKGRAWGPAETSAGQEADLRRLTWAASGVAVGDDRDSAVQDARALVGLAQTRRSDGSTETRGACAAIYRIAWRVRYGQKLNERLARTATRKRWLGDDGNAWRLVGCARNFNAAYHSLKLLAGGVRGRAQGRSVAARARAHRCSGCDTRDIRVVWRSPTDDEDGVAWCAGCRPLDARGLLEALRTHGHENVEHGARAAVGSGEADDRWRCSRHGACPLCQGGEAGSEHLLQWCPAVQATLESFTGGANTLGRECNGISDHGQQLNDLLHQAAYLHGTLAGRHATTWRRAARILMAGIRQASGDEAGHDHDENDADLVLAGGDEPDICPTWDDPEDHGCSECTGQIARGVARRATDPACDHAAQHGLWRPCAPFNLAAGESAMVQVADAAMALWPAEGRRWCPPPRTVDDGDANCDWHLLRCGECRRYRRLLRARTDLHGGTELTIPHGLGGNIGWSGEVGGTLVSFDGGAREVRGRRVAGGAAILWGIAGGVRVPAVTRMWVIPLGSDSMVAEAWGARMGLELLDEEGQAGPATVVGDNLPVIRYCGDVGRLRQPHLHAILDSALTRNACAGRGMKWVAVRRRYNGGADRAATEACSRAAFAAEQGRTDAHCVTIRHG